LTRNLATTPLEALASMTIVAVCQGIVQNLQTLVIKN
jgi:hypothetical protein